MTIIGVILNITGPLRELGTYSASLNRYSTKACDAKCISSNVITYAEFKQQMSGYDIAAVVCQLTSAQRHIVEELHYVTPAMDTYMFIDMHKLLAEEPTIIAEYMYALSTDTTFVANNTYFIRLADEYTVATIYELAYHKPSEYYFAITDETGKITGYTPVTDTTFDISKTYYQKNERYQAIAIVSPDDHSPSEYYLKNEDGTYSPCEDTEFHSEKSYYEKNEDDTYTLVPLFGTKIPSDAVYYHQNTNTKYVKNWDQLQAYLNGLESDILQKFICRTLVPRMWKTAENKYEETPFYSNITSEFRIRSVENTMGIEVEFGDHDKPYHRYNLGFHWDYPDLVIRNQSVETTIDLDNSIPIVNGSVFFPSVWTNIETQKKEMFAHQAGKWIYHDNWNSGNVKSAPHIKIPTTKLFHTKYDLDKGGHPSLSDATNYNKNILLVDFSPLGTIETIKLSSCKNGVIHGTEIVSGVYDTIITRKTDPKHAWLKSSTADPLKTSQCSYYAIEFDLPQGTETGIPIAVIGGRMFFYNENVFMQDRGGTLHMRVEIEKELYQHIIASNLQWFGKQINGTQFVENVVEPTLKEMFVDTEMGNGTEEDAVRLMYEDLSVPYVIMLHSSKKVVISHIRPRMMIKPDKFLFPPHVGGILMNRKTREIVDYTRILYGSSTMVTTCMQRPLKEIDNGFKKLTEPHLFYERLNYTKRSKYIDFYPSHEHRALDYYELIDFAYQE